MSEPKTIQSIRQQVKKVTEMPQISEQLGLMVGDTVLEIKEMLRALSRDEREMMITSEIAQRIDFIWTAIREYDGQANIAAQVVVALEAARQHGEERYAELWESWDGLLTAMALGDFKANEALRDLYREIKQEIIEERSDQIREDVERSVEDTRYDNIHANMMRHGFSNLETGLILEMMESPDSFMSESTAAKLREIVALVEEDAR